MWLFPLFQYSVVSGFPLDGNLFPFEIWFCLFLSFCVIYKGCSLGSVLMRSEYLEVGAGPGLLEGLELCKGSDTAGMIRMAEQRNSRVDTRR